MPDFEEALSAYDAARDEIARLNSEPDDEDYDGERLKSSLELAERDKQDAAQGLKAAIQKMIEDALAAKG